MSGYTPTPNSAGTLQVLLGSVGGVNDSSGHWSAGSYTLIASWPPPLYAGFTPADVGRRITVMRAGASGGLLITTVATYISRTEVTLHDAARATVANDSGLVTIYRPISTLIGTLSASMSLTTRDTFQFTVDYHPTDPVLSQNVLPVVRQPVLIVSTVAGVGDSYGAVLGGTVDQVRLSNEPGSTLVHAECQGLTWDYLASKRVMQGMSWAAKSGGTIAGDIVSYGLGANSSSDESVGYDNAAAEAGADPTVDTFTVANWTVVSDALDSICQLVSGGSSGGLTTNTYFWTVDAWRIVHFALQSSWPAPWNIDDRDGSAGNVLIQVSATNTREKYCNHAYVDASKEILPDLLQDPGQWGDGTNRTFSAAYSIATKPSITIIPYNSSKTTPGTPSVIPAANIGILNVDSANVPSNLRGTYNAGTTYAAGDGVISTINGALYCSLYDGNTGHEPVEFSTWWVSTKKWYWTPGSNSVTQDASEPVLRTTWALFLTYYTSGERLSFSENASAVAESSAIEGLSGFYETVTSLDTVAAEADVDSLATSIASRYGEIPQTIEVVTYRGGLKPGQSVEIYLAAINVSGTFLVSDVTLQATTDNLLQWTIKAIDGALIGDWLKAFRDWANKTSAVAGGVTPDTVTGPKGINVTADTPVVSFAAWANVQVATVSGHIYVVPTDLMIDQLRGIELIAYGGPPGAESQYQILTMDRPASGIWPATIDYTNTIGFQPSADETWTMTYFCYDATGAATAPIYTNAFTVPAANITSVTATDETALRWVDPTSDALHAVVSCVPVVSNLPMLVTMWLDKGQGAGPEWQGWDQMDTVGQTLYIGIPSDSNGGGRLTDLVHVPTTGVLYPPTNADETWTLYAAAGAYGSTDAIPAGVASQAFTMQAVGPALPTDISDLCFVPSPDTGDPIIYFYNSLGQRCWTPYELDYRTRPSVDPNYWAGFFTVQYGHETSGTGTVTGGINLESTSGDPFTSDMEGGGTIGGVGFVIHVNGVWNRIATYIDPTHVTLITPVADGVGQAYQVWNRAPDYLGINEDPNATYEGRRFTDVSEVDDQADSFVQVSQPFVDSTALAQYPDGSGDNVDVVCRFLAYALSRRGTDSEGGQGTITLQSGWMGGADHFDLYPDLQPETLDGTLINPLSLDDGLTKHPVSRRLMPNLATPLTILSHQITVAQKGISTDYIGDSAVIARTTSLAAIDAATGAVAAGHIIDTMVKSVAAGGGISIAKFTADTNVFSGDVWLSRGIGKPIMGLVDGGLYLYGQADPTTGATGLTSKPYVAVHNDSVGVFQKVDGASVVIDAAAGSLTLWQKNADTGHPYLTMVADVMSLVNGSFTTTISAAQIQMAYSASVALTLTAAGVRVQNGTYSTNVAAGGVSIASGAVVGTSTASLAVAAVSKTFTGTTTGLPCPVGVRVRATSHGTPSAWMEGAVTSYSGSTLVVNVDTIGGTGTHSDWDISIAEMTVSSTYGLIVSNRAILGGDTATGGLLEVDTAGTTIGIGGTSTNRFLLITALMATFSGTVSVSKAGGSTVTIEPTYGTVKVSNGTADSVLDGDALTLNQGTASGDGTMVTGHYGLLQYVNSISAYPTARGIEIQDYPTGALTYKVQPYFGRTTVYNSVATAGIGAVIPYAVEDHLGLSGNYATTFLLVGGATPSTGDYRVEITCDSAVAIAVVINISWQNETGGAGVNYTVAMPSASWGVSLPVRIAGAYGISYSTTTTNTNYNLHITLERKA